MPAPVPRVCKIKTWMSQRATKGKFFHLGDEIRRYQKERARWGFSGFCSFGSESINSLTQIAWGMSCCPKWRSLCILGSRSWVRGDWQMGWGCGCNDADAAPVRCGKERDWAVTKRTRLWILAVEISFLQRLAGLSLTERVKSRDAIPPHQKEPVEMVWVSD